MLFTVVKSNVGQETFMLMKNVDFGIENMICKFDLKGSLQGRRVITDFVNL